ncbi:hypothetical protein ADL22_06220 [Streptomyces sp. NRRL F-4489]|uniref:hypothetical protein n=1 Tax=Streptomyces sp. NRRL F-4489 TaxID=1609095 RepID=UPI000748E4AD|nr:hypothetical protein [Streptomyces sp. NRRL F-4489]KUL51390.1 hypothetical protein ADL22_06220 [Streptomyces sp. NRRL F-4489]
MRESDSATERRQRRPHGIPYGAIGLCLALVLSVAGIAWAAGLDESGVEVAPSGADTLRPVATPATVPAPRPAGLPGPDPRSRPR